MLHVRCRVTFAWLCVRDYLGLSAGTRLGYYVDQYGWTHDVWAGDHCRIDK